MCAFTLLTRNYKDAGDSKSQKWMVLQLIHSVGGLHLPHSFRSSNPWTGLSSIKQLHHNWSHVGFHCLHRSMWTLLQLLTHSPKFVTDQTVKRTSSWFPHQSACTSDDTGRSYCSIHTTIYDLNLNKFLQRVYQHPFAPVLFYQ